MMPFLLRQRWLPPLQALAADSPSPRSKLQSAAGLGARGGDKPRPLHPADDPLAPFREVGFTNLAMGTIGLASLWAPSCRVPAVRAGEIFLLLAGIAHMRRGNRNATENAALWSDLAAAVILIVSVVSALVR